MADYYPVLVRAVSRLAINDAQARQQVYRRARAFLGAELGKQGPVIARERAAFDTAVRHVEAEYRSVRGRTTESQKSSPMREFPEITRADREVSIQRDHFANNEKGASKKPVPAAAQGVEVIAGTKTSENAVTKISGMPQSLGSMLISIAFVVGMLSFIALIYIRGLVSTYPSMSSGFQFSLRQ